ncbi:restriction endonuclease subunit S [Rhodococcus sp. R1101]|uniref:restriction endonuclease subunit S n=1 Tax=Rhodococcus sp. R1101 TaxID=1170698 RepID=UPI0009DACED3|nr:restriction endonuclease subunit S [Rhodococcus sp. R1101]
MSAWAKVKLGEICEFKYGKSLPQGARQAGEFSVYGSNGIVGSHSRSLTTGPTIVVGRKGSLGEVNYSELPCWPIDTTYYVDESATDVNLRWLYHCLGSLGLTRLNRAAAIPGLNREDAYRLLVLLPPIDEQRRIAQTLDHADTLRAKRREAIARLDELTQAIFIDMFGDPSADAAKIEWTTIGAMLQSAQYGTSEKSGSEGEFPVLRMGNITYDGRIDLSDLKYMDLPAEKVARFTVRSGDILFNRTNSAELVGKTAVFRGDRPVSYAGYLVRLRVKEGNSPEYISSFLNSKYGKAVLRGMCKSIVGMANINAKEVQAIRIPDADQAVQQQFAERCKRIEDARSQHLSALDDLNSLFLSLQSRAFRGEL